jgi:hypothetical protein
MTPSAPAQTVVQTGPAPTPPPAFASDPQGKKPKTKSPFSTFLGAGSAPTAPQQASSGKTLLGQ